MHTEKIIPLENCDDHSTLTIINILRIAQKKRVRFSSRTSDQTFLKTRSETNRVSVKRRGWDYLYNLFDGDSDK